MSGIGWMCELRHREFPAIFGWMCQVSLFCWHAHTHWVIPLCVTAAPGDGGAVRWSLHKYSANWQDQIIITMHLNTIISFYLHMIYTVMQVWYILLADFWVFEAQYKSCNLILGKTFTKQQCFTQRSWEKKRSHSENLCVPWSKLSQYSSNSTLSNHYSHSHCECKLTWTPMTAKASGTKTFAFADLVVRQTGGL